MRAFKSKSPKSQTHAFYVLSSHPEIHPLSWALRAENQLPAVCTGDGAHSFICGLQTAVIFKSLSFKT